MMRLRYFGFLLSFGFLAGCTTPIVKSVDRYKLAERESLYKLTQWSFAGRLALSDGKESWSASIDWVHKDNRDELKLSGPLGQGAVAIIVTDSLVTIDKGDDKIEQSAEIDEFVAQQAGIAVPVRSLSYWVLGLTDPKKEFSEKADGFEQEDWVIHYSEMQQAVTKVMPRKIQAQKNQVKLKLIIDDWLL